MAYAITTSQLRRRLHKIPVEAIFGQALVETTISQFSRPFSDCVSEIVGVFEQSLDGFPDNLFRLADFDCAVYLKNRERVIVYSNEAHRNMFSVDHRTVGLAPENFLDTSNIGVSKHSDMMLMSGAKQIDFEHVGRAADGLYYLIRTHKRSLLHMNIRGLAILGVSRFEGLVESKDLTPRLNWSDQIEVFSRLDPRDREICRQISLGITTREIAAQLKITPRSVESRKQKILEALSLPNTVEMIKLLVRFQEHGIADLGI